MTRTILAIDDDVEVLELYKEVSDLVPDISLYVVESGESALEELSKLQSQGVTIDAALVDGELGRGIDGIRTVQGIQDTAPTATIYMTSNHPDYQEWATEQGIALMDKSSLADIMDAMRG